MLYIIFFFFLICRRFSCEFEYFPLLSLYEEDKWTTSSRFVNKAESFCGVQQCPAMGFSSSAYLCFRTVNTCKSAIDCTSALGYWCLVLSASFMTSKPMYLLTYIYSVCRLVYFLTNGWTQFCTLRILVPFCGFFSWLISNLSEWSWCVVFHNWVDFGDFPCGIQAHDDYSNGWSMSPSVWKPPLFFQAGKWSTLYFECNSNFVLALNIICWCLPCFRHINFFSCSKSARDLQQVLGLWLA